MLNLRKWKKWKKQPQPPMPSRTRKYGQNYTFNFSSRILFFSVEDKDGYTFKAYSGVTGICLESPQKTALATLVNWDVAT